MTGGIVRNNAERATLNVAKFGLNSTSGFSRGLKSEKFTIDGQTDDRRPVVAKANMILRVRSAKKILNKTKHVLYHFYLHTKLT